MSFRFRILPAAQADVFAAEDRLEREQAGYGTAFGGLMATAVADLTDRPRSFAPAEDGPPGVEVREAFVARFEYRVIFVVDGDEVAVIAVIHARRKPGAWLRRLTELN